MASSPQHSPQLASSLDSRSASTVSSDATLPGDATPVASEVRRTGSHSRYNGSNSISSSLASSEANRRLRDAEDEVRRLRELNSRLRAEGAVSSGLSPTRIKQLQEDARASFADAPGRKANSNLFKQVCSTDLLFLIDTTSSMSGHINAAKEQVKSIVNDIIFAFLGEAEVRIAVVGYKDHQDSPNIQFLDFTTDVNRVRTFIDMLRASGGGDAPEDMLGGIRSALNSTWLNHTKCIIHIADAPPHGRVNHDLDDGEDRFATPGTEPHQLHFQPLISQMVDLHINYALLRINYLTDRTAFNFLKAYLAAGSDCKLHTANKYYTEACDLIAGASKSHPSGNSSFRSSKAKLQFEEAELGTSYEKLRHMVVRNVTTSASRTAVRLSASSGMAKPKFGSKLVSTGMGAIMEDEDHAAAPEVALETIAPQWDKKSWFSETLTLEGFSPDVGVHGASTLNDMMEDDENIKMSITELTINKRPRPFAQGAMRVAAYARTKNSKNKYVVKAFQKQGKKLAHLAEDMRCQALCKAFALEFSALVGEASSLDFITTTCLRGKGGGRARDEHLSLEPLIEGTYQKYCNNTNWVNRDDPDDLVCQAAQAFAHFTFERSRGRFLVTDLQGVGRLLTDPAIHTRDDERFKLSDTNLGKEGFKFFFSSHECNDTCRKLKLQSSRAMFVSGTFTYRSDWPRMDNVVCCSNKLCGKILQLASSKTSAEFPGHHWCDVCFPQLEATVVQLLCVVPGPHHEFKASRFFFESQGRHPPRLCVEHRDDDTALFRPEAHTSTAVITDTYRMMPAELEATADISSRGVVGARSAESDIIPVLPESATTPEPQAFRPAIAVGTASDWYPTSPSRSRGANSWAKSTADSVDICASAAPAALPYMPYTPSSMAKTKTRFPSADNPAAMSRLSLTNSTGGFWSKLKKRSLSFKPSSGMLKKKDGEF